MLRDFASTNGQELWNTTRLQAYLTNVGSPFATGPGICTCPALTAAVLDGPVGGYDTPAADPAPWFDVDTPVSAEYLGFLPLSIAGAEDDPRARTVTNAVGGGGVFGPVRALPRTITVTGIILGTTCCGAEYGLHYLSEALQGCNGSACDGGCFEMYECCPDNPGLTPVQFNAKYRRTFRRTALVSGPTVVKRDGTGSCGAGTCAAGSEILTVEFVLVAATPWAWTDPLPLLDVTLPMNGLSPCIDWCLRNPVTDTGACDPSECLFGDCTTTDTCADPMFPVPAPPQPTAPLTSFCVSIGSERACYSIDLTTRPQWSNDVPVIILTAGTSDLRNVRILLFENPVGTSYTCDQLADINRCNAQNEFLVTYLQANGTITLDGQIGRPITECRGDCGTSTTVYGNQDGGPVTFNEMSCAHYCLCIETDPAFPPAADARLAFAVSGRGL